MIKPLFFEKNYFELAGETSLGSVFFANLSEPLS